MTNTYMQDKLDTFEQFLMDKCPSHTNNSPDGFEKWLENLDIDELTDYAMDYRNKALTDYHNHIVEKILHYYQENILYIGNEVPESLARISDMDRYVMLGLPSDIQKILRDTNK